MKHSLFFRLSKIISRAMLHGSVRIWGRTSIEHPAIFVANHPSTLDPFFVIGTLPQPVRILISEYIFQIPLVGYALRQAGHIKVENGKGRQAYLNARQALLRGGSLLIFPEGVVSADKSSVGPLCTGAVRLAMETHTPIIPLGISLNPDKIKKNTVRFGKNVETSDWYSNGFYGISFGDKLSFAGDVRNRTEVQRQCSLLRERMENQVREASYLMRRENLKEAHAYNLLSILIYFFRMHFAYTNR